MKIIYESERSSLLIAPEGIEIFLTGRLRKLLTLLIAPEGIEITIFVRFVYLPHHPFNRTRRN